MDTETSNEIIHTYPKRILLIS